MAQNYGVDTKIMDFLMQQSKPGLDSEYDETDPEDYGAILDKYQNMDVAQPDRGISRPSYLAGMAKGAAQMGTIGGKAADTSALSEYADKFEKQKLMDDALKRRRREKVFNYVTGLQKEKRGAEASEKAYLRGIASSDRRFLQRESGKDKRVKAELEAKKLSWTIPGVGVAQGPANYQKLIAGTENKLVLDRTINQMIALRKKHKGASLTNRADVEHAKQLSMKLVLAYKNLAKLGVLSAMDEKILKRIIPYNPLGLVHTDAQFAESFNPFVGKDPLLHKMVKFRDDADKEYITSVELRTYPEGRDQDLVAEYERRRKIGLGAGYEQSGEVPKKKSGKVIPTPKQNPVLFTDPKNLPTKKAKDVQERALIKQLEEEEGKQTDDLATVDYFK